jgi:hypothetical protein
MVSRMSEGSGAPVKIAATYCVDKGEYEFASEGARDAFLADPQFKFDFHIDNVDDQDGVERIFGSSEIQPYFSENPPRFTKTRIEPSEVNSAIAVVSVELKVLFDILVSFDDFLDWVENEGETWRYSGRIECVGETGLLNSEREEYESFEVVETTAPPSGHSLGIGGQGSRER